MAEKYTNPIVGDVEACNLAILRVEPGDAPPYSLKHIMRLARRITRHGILKPVMIDEEDRVLSGHDTLPAAQMLGMSAVPVVRLTHLSDEQKCASRFSELLGRNPRAEEQLCDDPKLAVRDSTSAKAIVVTVVTLVIVGHEESEA